MSFQTFAQQIASNFKSLTEKATELYKVDISGDELYELYLSSHAPGTNDMFKTRGEADCSSCKHFIRHYGSVVAIVDETINTFWAMGDNFNSEFNCVANALAEKIKSLPIVSTFLSYEKNLGIHSNRQLLEDNSIKTWYHLHGVLPSKFVVGKTKSLESLAGERKANYDVFKRSMGELTITAAQTILELVEQGSIYRGEEHKAALNEFVKYKIQYENLGEVKRDTWLWANSKDNFVCRIRNTAIGTLLIDISNGADLDESVTKFEKIMAPANYKRPKAIITQKMINDAEKTINELGFASSLGRRHACPEDISVEHVLFVNRDTRPKMAGGLLGDLKPNAPVKVPEFNKVGEISADEFFTKVLPECSSVEVMVENRHFGNFMSLISPEDKSAPSMFKWGNNFSWAYNGDIADSMREEVKSRGGNIDGPFRFTHSWNHDGQNQSLMDLHVFMPGCKHHSDNIKDCSYGSNQERVGWNHRSHPKSGGVQDVDYTNPPGKNIPIENISFPNLKKMPEGLYVCKVHNWQARNPNTSGFKAEIELNGELYQYEYPTRLERHEWVTVAEVTLKDGKFTIDNKLKPTSMTSKEIWGVKTNDFTKVSMVTISPNHWGDVGVGNKHYFFILDRCINDGNARGFFNEFLRNDLDKHKRVFEALGSKMKVPASAQQLSGIGFSTTQSNSVVVRVEGKSKRMLKVIF